MTGTRPVDDYNDRLANEISGHGFCFRPLKLMHGCRNLKHGFTRRPWECPWPPFSGGERGGGERAGRMRRRHVWQQFVASSSKALDCHPKPGKPGK